MLDKSMERLVGPSISLTFAPSSLAIFANEYPILPEELFPIYLTGSIFSCVGPAVIKKFIEFNGKEFLNLFST